MSERNEKGEIVFLSKDPNLRVVRIPQRRRYNERGELEVLPGEVYEFKRGSFLTKDESVAEWMRNHEKFNSKFYEVGNEPDRISPTLDEVMGQITGAAANGDLIALAEIYDREKATHDRAPVLAAAEKGMEAIEARNASAEGSLAPEPVTVPPDVEESDEA